MPFLACACCIAQVICLRSLTSIGPEPLSGCSIWAFCHGNIPGRVGVMSSAARALWEDGRNCRSFAIEASRG